MKAWLVWFVPSQRPRRLSAGTSRLRDLFIFGAGDNVLVLGGPPPPTIRRIRFTACTSSPLPRPATPPSSFLTNAISANVTNIPSARGGGQTFALEGPRPPLHPGPIYAERAQTWVAAACSSG